VLRLIEAKRLIIRVLTFTLPSASSAAQETSVRFHIDRSNCGQGT